ncbi:MAG: small subunit ribosomal protein S16 [Planctomycetota bacterium]|jgi:small subunit ribosomal protein S16
MLKIRLQRIGRRHDPHFRVVVTDARRGPKSGNFIEILGSYNAKMGEIKLEGDRIKYWISVGAQTSGTVHNFLVDQKIIEGKKQNVLPKKTPIIKEKTEEAAPAVAEPKPAEAEAPTEEAPTEEAPIEEAAPAPVEEVPAEEAPEVVVEETTEETPAVEIPVTAEESAEEDTPKEEAPAA